MAVSAHCGRNLGHSVENHFLLGLTHHPQQSPGRHFGKGEVLAQGAVYFGCRFSALRTLGLKDVECFCLKKQRLGLGRVALTPHRVLCLNFPSVPPSSPSW